MPRGCACGPSRGASAGCSSPPCCSARSPSSPCRSGASTTGALASAPAAAGPATHLHNNTLYRPGAGVHAHFDSASPCSRFPDTDDVLLVMKTGASEAYDKLPAHLLTSLPCLADLLLFSDLVRLLLPGVPPAPLPPLFVLPRLLALISARRRRREKSALTETRRATTGAADRQVPPVRRPRRRSRHRQAGQQGVRAVRGPAPLPRDAKGVRGRAPRRLGPGQVQVPAHAGAHLGAAAGPALVRIRRGRLVRLLLAQPSAVAADARRPGPRGRRERTRGSAARRLERAHGLHARGPRRLSRSRTSTTSSSRLTSSPPATPGTTCPTTCASSARTRTARPGPTTTVAPPPATPPPSTAAAPASSGATAPASAASARASASAAPAARPRRRPSPGTAAGSSATSTTGSAPRATAPSAGWSPCTEFRHESIHGSALVCVVPTVLCRLFLFSTRLRVIDWHKNTTSSALAGDAQSMPALPLWACSFVSIRPCCPSVWSPASRPKSAGHVQAASAVHPIGQSRAPRGPAPETSTGAWITGGRAASGYHYTQPFCPHHLVTCPWPCPPWLSAAPPSPATTPVFFPPWFPQRWWSLGDFMKQ